jgi:hypothetical protein
MDPKWYPVIAIPTLLATLLIAYMGNRFIHSDQVRCNFKSSKDIESHPVVTTRSTTLLKRIVPRSFSERAKSAKQLTHPSSASQQYQPPIPKPKITSPLVISERRLPQEQDQGNIANQSNVSIPGTEAV